MGQFLQVNGDYNIKTKETGTITLDTGAGVGEVRVTGNLVVDGDTLTVSAENLNVQDNIITLNYGETGAGVTLRYSGIEIARGTEPNVSLIYDELDDSWNLKTGSGYYPSRLRLGEILTDSDQDDGNLLLIGTGAGVVHVDGTLNYASNVIAFGDNAIPNKKYVDDAIQTNPTFQILRSDTRVSAFDITDPIDSELFPIGPYYVQPTESLVAVVVNDSIVGQFYQNRVQLSGVTFFTEDPTPANPLIPDAAVIQTNNTNANIKLETNGTGKVQITYAVQLDNHGATPASVADASLIYGGSVGAGTTGIYFTNTSKNDELVSKSRALLFSMIF